MLYDYSKLVIRIEEVFESKEAFGQAMDWSLATTENKLNNRSKWAIAEIKKAAQLLNIPGFDCSSYFFTVKETDVTEDLSDKENNISEAAQLFNNLPIELQDEILILMRKLASENAQQTG